jgi:hypothetical protein
MRTPRELNYRTYSCHRGAGGNGCMKPRDDFEIVALFCAARTAFRLPDALVGSFSNTLHILQQHVLKVEGLFVDCARPRPEYQTSIKRRSSLCLTGFGLSLFLPLTSS